MGRRTARGGDLVVADLRVAAATAVAAVGPCGDGGAGLPAAPRAGAVDVERFEAALAGRWRCLADRPEAALAGLEEALGCGGATRSPSSLGSGGRRGRRRGWRSFACTPARPTPRRCWGGAQRGGGERGPGGHGGPSGPGAGVADAGGRLASLWPPARRVRAAGEYRARLRDESGLDPSKDFAALEARVAVDGSSAPHPPSATSPRRSRASWAATGRTEPPARRGQPTPTRHTHRRRRRGKTRLATEIAWSWPTSSPMASGLWSWRRWRAPTRWPTPWPPRCRSAARRACPWPRAWRTRSAAAAAAGPGQLRTRPRRGRRAGGADHRRRARRSRCWPRAGSRSAWPGAGLGGAPAAAGGGWRGAVLRPGRRRRRRVHAAATPTWRSSPGSANGSTASPWRSSWPPPGSGR